MGYPLSTPKTKTASVSLFNSLSLTHTHPHTHTHTHTHTPHKHTQTHTHTHPCPRSGLNSLPLITNELPFPLYRVNGANQGPEGPLNYWFSHSFPWGLSIQMERRERERERGERERQKDAMGTITVSTKKQQPRQNRHSVYTTHVLKLY